jgi:hypothetical protein
MDNRDRIAIKVAKKLSLPNKKVVEVLTSHFMLAATTMRQSIDRTIYIPHIGYYMPRTIQRAIYAQKVENRKNRVYKNQEEEPVRF